MSDQDEIVAMLSQIGEAFNEGGFEALLGFAHAEFEFHEPPEQLGATVLRGHDEARAGFRRWAETWAEQQSEPQGFEVLPDGRILVYTRERMLGRDGLRVEQDSGQLLTLRDGKILRWQVFWDPAGARAAAGL